LTIEYYFWFRAAGIAIPRDLSMISFDNMTQSIFLPVSTIDFGLARLGYLAAHLLIGDIAVRADRHGFVPGPCTLADRGSIGAPSRNRRAEVFAKG
jgi:DNA-binding LacI/PurR family transcriptional regulator